MCLVALQARPGFLELVGVPLGDLPVGDTLSLSFFRVLVLSRFGRREHMQGLKREKLLDALESPVRPKLTLYFIHVLRYLCYLGRIYSVVQI